MPRSVVSCTAANKPSVGFVFSNDVLYTSVKLPDSPVDFNFAATTDQIRAALKSTEPYLWVGAVSCTALVALVAFERSQRRLSKRRKK